MSAVEQEQLDQRQGEYAGSRGFADSTSETPRSVAHVLPGECGPAKRWKVNEVEATLHRSQIIEHRGTSWAVTVSPISENAEKPTNCMQRQLRGVVVWRNEGEHVAYE